MSKKEKKKLLPKLRFPEFRDTGEWERKLLEEVSSYENGKAHEQDIDDFGKAIVVNSKFISTNGEVKKYTNTPYCLSEKEDILMVLSDVPNGRAIAKCFFVEASNLYTVNQRVCKITAEKIFSKYLFLLLDRNSYFLKFDDGVKQTNLRKEDVLNCPLSIPKNKKEQQKIADCLTSLDELITAQTEKIELLKKHKKGLMQQLFPKEGENIPLLRFPEFRDAGEWERKELGKLSTIVRGGSPRPIENYITSDLKGFNWLKIGDVDKGSKFVTRTQERVRKEALDKTRIVEPNDLIMSNSMSFGRPYIMKIQSCIHDGWIAVTDIINSIIELNFLYYVILTDSSQVYFSNSAAGGGIKNLNAEIIKKLPLSIPKNKKEQQKIADCLTSLDEHITAQTEKIELLKKHKKGLMQQLFPAEEENGE
ncbi:restriction endonuclease subunit S [Pigmentibacter ruber]